MVAGGSDSARGGSDAPAEDKETGWRWSLQASPFASLQKITRVAADAGTAAAQVAAAE